MLILFQQDNNKFAQSATQSFDANWNAGKYYTMYKWLKPVICGYNSDYFFTYDGWIWYYSRIAQALNGELFSDKDKERIVNNMRMAIQLANQAKDKGMVRSHSIRIEIHYLKFNGHIKFLW